ncbi:MAG: hypothetical protein U5N86_04655 [Planctomycetota bacterium]|nr:hypothetical protein [Planctomycetota bacterium]
MNQNAGGAKGTSTLERVAARLWALDDEYEKLKRRIDDDKVMLAALKQQADLLVLITKHGAEDGENETHEPHLTPDQAAEELRELYSKLQPILAS